MSIPSNVRRGPTRGPEVFAQTKAMGLRFCGDQRQPLIRKGAAGAHRAGRTPLSVFASPAPEEGLGRRF